MKKFVWDTSAILNIKEPNSSGYSPGHSLYKDLKDGWIEGPYLNIFPAIAFFEKNAGISRMHREHKKILRDFYILGEDSMVYPIDQELVEKSYELVEIDGFNKLRGADLVFACIAKIEDAWLVTRDKHFLKVKDHINVIDLNESIDEAKYREYLIR